MPELSNPFTSAPTAEPTTADVIAREILALAEALPKTMVDTHQQIYHKLWTRSVELGTSPQAVLDSIGPKGAALFHRGGELVTFLLTTGITQMEPEEYQPKQTPTFNQDGTVTLSGIQP